MSLKLSSASLSIDFISKVKCKCYNSMLLVVSQMQICLPFQQCARSQYHLILSREHKLIKCEQP